MGRFRNRVLGVLDNVYGFVSGKTASSEIQTETPITLVHDLSREAELGSGLGSLGGYLVYEYIQAVAGAASYRYSDPVYDSLASSTLADPTISQYDLWYTGLCGLWVEAAGVGDVTYVGLGWEYPVGSTDFVTTQPVFIPLFYGSTGQVQLSDASAAASIYASVGVSGISNPHPYARPFLLPRTARFNFFLTTGAAIAAPGAIIWHILWGGKRGTTPPGMR